MTMEQGTSYTYLLGEPHVRASTKGLGFTVLIRPVVSGKHMFDILPAEYKSLAVRTKVRYVSPVVSRRPVSSG